jgi:hypothetical protein
LLAKTNDYKQERQIHPYSGAIICEICRKNFLHVQKFLIAAQNVLSVLHSSLLSPSGGESGVNIGENSSKSPRRLVLLVRMKKDPDASPRKHLSSARHPTDITKILRRCAMARTAADIMIESLMD